MKHSPELLIKKLGLETPLIGLYDAPGNSDFGDIVSPGAGKHPCFFAHYKSWLRGKTVRLSEDNHGCGGCGKWLFGKQGRSRQEYIEFLADEEGLKANHALMDEWFGQAKNYRSRHGTLFVGPLKEGMDKYLKTVTFFVNPDQLSVLMTGAQYHSRPGDPEPVTAPFGSGCMQMLPLFDNPDTPQAIIGATDMAMRQYLPPNILAFTATIPMYDRLCSIGENSFLSRAFIKTLKKARGGKL
jgi:hypothetical protein